jgi:rhodanese-related sulfurtransferase
MKKSVVQIATLTVAAVVIALAANAFAGRTRKLVLPGYYPNALKVPKRVVETPRVPLPPWEQTSAPATVTETAATIAQPPVTETTTTTVAPATATEVTGRLKPAPTSPAPSVNLLERFPPHPDKPYADIGGDDAAFLHARGALFLDARRSSVYEQGHIAGARSFSVWESDIDEKVNKLFEERGDPEQQLQPIVIYCSGGACEDSHMLAQKLYGIQFNNIYVYKDGFPDWEKRNGPTRKGGQP